MPIVFVNVNESIIWPESSKCFEVVQYLSIFIFDFSGSPYFSLILDIVSNFLLFFYLQQFYKRKVKDVQYDNLSMLGGLKAIKTLRK